MSGTQLDSGERRDVHDVDVAIILTAQHQGGAYPAGAGFSQYDQCWLRDGSFIAYAMDLAGEHESASRFHRWVARTIVAHRHVVHDLIARRARDEGIGEFDFLPARFTPDGQWLQDGWPNFQLDGYGQWLWSLAEHLLRAGAGALPSDLRPAVELVVDYLLAFWDEPCYDAWEEGRSQLHTATLGSIFAGLRAISDPYLPRAAEGAERVRTMVLTECVRDGRFVKCIGNPAVDASLLWLSTPFALVPDTDPRMVATVARIEADLLHGGGVRRYAADTYYGGGEWIILSAWLAWHKARVGAHDQARSLMAWVEAQREEDGGLPEQVPGASVNERFLEHWTRRWGPAASPLAWSHAMAIVARDAMRDCDDSGEAAG
ncbi:MAG: glycoside hydrolase family 15 protein [Trueperaceae bacterium]